MTRSRSCQLVALLLGSITLPGIVLGVEVKFTSPDNGGFFVRHDDDDHRHSAAGDLASGHEGIAEVKATEFTVLDTKQPVTVRASYGPFTSQETVYPNLNQNEDDLSNLYQPGPIHFTAHLVNTEVRKETPVLRVVFSGKPRHRKPLCVLLHATAESNATEVQSFISPRGDADNFLGELVIPSSWWPPLNSKVGKQPKQLITISYSVQAQCGKNQVAVLSRQVIGEIPLTTGQAGYRQISGEDELLHLLIPQSATYPGSSIYVPVFVEQPTRGLLSPAASTQPGNNGRHFIESADNGARLTVLVVRANARKGAKIVNVEGTSENWDIRVELNARGSVATVTAFRKDLQNNTDNSGPEEVFNFLYQVDKADHQVWKGCKLSWHVKYQLQDHTQKTSHVRGPRLRHKLHVNKDDVQAVLPISKSRELVNTAVLTGRQVSDPLKILMVSQAGDIADVTLHASCTTNDDSALKVSSSCTSVYLDGSESRGAISAQIQAKYGTYSGSAELRVWMPEIPVNLVIPDPHLAIIDGWRVPERTYAKRSAGPEMRKGEDWKGKGDEKEELDMELWEGEWKEMEGSGGGGDPFMMGEEILPLQFNSVKNNIKENDKKKTGGCNNRFQQTRVQVFTRFTAEDPDSGRRDYFISRSVEVDLTDITTKSIRLQDPRIAYLEGNILRGISVGRTEVQVISPVTGRVIGSSEIKVQRSKETVTGINVKLVTGINLAVNLEAEEGVYTPRAEIARQLTSKYQEGILDIEVVFSDGAITPLSDLDADEYMLSVESLNPDIIAFAPAAGSTHPRVIAVGEGEGDLLNVAIDMVEKCDMNVGIPLASDILHLAVHTSGQHPTSSVQEKKKEKKRKKKPSKPTSSIKSVDMGDISEVLSNIALRDDNSHNMVKKHYSPDTQDPIYMNNHDEANTLEVGMYILLGVFCVAISVFMASCFVYASKHNQPHAGFPLQERSRSVQNAHDWVWLGRQTLDKSSVCTSASKDIMDTSLRSRTSSAYTGRVIGYPSLNNTGTRMDYPSNARRQINIIPNPCIDFSNAQRNNRQTAGIQGAGMPVYNPIIEETPERGLAEDMTLDQRPPGNLHESLIADFPSPASIELTAQHYQRSPSSIAVSHHHLIHQAPITMHPTAGSAGQPHPTDGQPDPFIIPMGPSPVNNSLLNGDVYAELPRRRGPCGGNNSSGVYERRDWRDRGHKSPRAGRKHGSGESKSHYQHSSHNYQDDDLSEGLLHERKMQPHLERRRFSDSSDVCSSVCTSSTPSSKPSINSATYTRPKVVDPQGDILPVGFPVFSSLGQETEDEYGEESRDGFQNPWEALHSALQGSKHENSLLIQKGADLSLDLNPAMGGSNYPTSPYQLFTRQSPASALPPDTWEDNTDSGKGSLSRGEYTPLNPDINKATPPRYGSLKRIKDPFKVSENESPSIPMDKLSPTTIFNETNLSSPQDPLNTASEAINDSAVENYSDLSELSRDDDDVSSVCSVTSSELGPIAASHHQQQYTLPPLDSMKLRQQIASVSALSSPTYSHVVRCQDAPTNLDSIELGALDYEQLMNYFEDLRESAA